MFPLKAAYRRANNTIEGRQKAVGEEDPDWAKEEGEREFDLWLGDDPPPSGEDPSGATTAGSPPKETPLKPAGFKHDTLGRPYAVDDYGRRWFSTSGRPTWFPAKEWHSRTEEERKEIIAMHGPEPAAPAEPEGEFDDFDAIK